MDLDQNERAPLITFSRRGRIAARRLERVQILLAAGAGVDEAGLVATACSGRPEGRNRWSLTLLADTIVRLTEHDGLMRVTVRRRLAENALEPWGRDMWCGPKIDGAYMACMEDVLDR